MKYTIDGFSQMEIVRLGLNSTDSRILRWVIDFYVTGKMVKIQHENKEYIWINYQAIIEDLPSIEIENKRAIQRRFKKFVDCGLMMTWTKKDKEGSYSMYHIVGDVLEGLLNDTRSTQKYNPADLKVQPPLDSKVHTKHSSININSSTNNQLLPVKPEVKKPSLTDQVKAEFDKRYLSLYGEPFSWGKSGGRYGKEITLIIANSSEDLEQIIRKMDILLSMVDNKYWKFNYSNLANKWNEITNLNAPTAEEWQENLITLWNRLTGAELSLSRPLVDVLNKRRAEVGETDLKRAVLAYSVSEWHSEKQEWNLVKMLESDKDITKYIGDYTIKKLAPVIKSKLGRPENSLFPEIRHDSNYAELMAYDWMQHGKESLIKHVIGKHGEEMLSGGHSIEQVIDKLYTHRVNEYSGGLVKRG